MVWLWGWYMENHQKEIREALIRVLKKRCYRLLETRADDISIELLDMEMNAVETKIDLLWEGMASLKHKKENLIRKIIKDKKMLSESKWRLDIRHYGQVSLYSDILEHKEIYEFLEKCNGDIYPHGRFPLEVEMVFHAQSNDTTKPYEKELVGIHCNDGELYISFLGVDNDPTIIKTFILENEIEVDIGNEVEKTRKFADDLDKVRGVLDWIGEDEEKEEMLETCHICGEEEEDCRMVEGGESWASYWICGKCSAARAITRGGG